MNLQFVCESSGEKTHYQGSFYRIDFYAIILHTLTLFNFHFVFKQCSIFRRNFKHCLIIILILSADTKNLFMSATLEDLSRRLERSFLVVVHDILNVVQNQNEN